MATQAKLRLHLSSQGRADALQKRLFADGTPPRSFELVSSNAMPSGIILSNYKVAGPLKTG